MQAPALERPDAVEAVRRLEAWMRDDRARRRVRAAAGDRTTVEEVGGGRFVYRYDRRGDLASVGVPGGAGATFRYDERRRLVAAERCGRVTRYAYDGDRLRSVDDGGLVRRFDYDAEGRLMRMRHGDGACRFAYDAAGRVTEARTPSVVTSHGFDEAGRLVEVRQEIDGVVLAARMAFDAAGRLAAMRLPGGEAPVEFEWDAAGRPVSVTLDGRPLASWQRDADARRTTLERANGIVEQLEADHVDGRPLQRTVRRGAQVLLARRYRYDGAGRVTADGARRYAYDALGRLARAEDAAGGAVWSYAYDERDNRVEQHGPGGVVRWASDAGDRVAAAEEPDARRRVEHDAWGRRTHESGPASRSFRYDDAGQLRQVLERGSVVADLTYDHKGRLVRARHAGGAERYLYGGDDELLAVTDEAGRPLRLVIRTTLGPLADVHGAVGSGTVHHLHLDDRGTCHAVTDAAGETVATLRYCPFGTPEADGPATARFGFREWHPRLRLYRLDARWYDPRTGRFLTPDSFTAAPDDERLVHPLVPAGGQAAARAAVLAAWLQRPRLANRYAYCGNDPVNRLDPSGHWSFGGVLLTLLGVVWTLPNTLIGLLIEITCLIGEVVRWLVWLVSWGAVSWEPPGIDAAASGRLNAFALVFAGGWLGSFPDLHGITFGNVFFVYGQWEQKPHYTGGGVVYPPAYKGKVSIPRRDSLYEHELRHTNQYGWLGPFFLPVYLFDALILSDYENAWLERDARDHAEGPSTPPVTAGPSAGGGLAASTGPAATTGPAAGSGPSAGSGPAAGGGAAAGGPLYAGYDLQRGDRDATRRWGGATRKAPGDPVPAKGETGYVRRLQEDLRTLGFGIVGTADGGFGRRSTWAVRELQGYAKMAKVAREEPGATGAYADRLRQVANPAVYAGPVSGVVDRATRDVIRAWLAGGVRCPVVIGAFGAGTTPGAPVPGRENVWAAGELTATRPYLFARDFTDHYTLPPGRAAADPVSVGRYSAYQRWGGPVTEAPGKKRPGHVWPEAEMLPERLAGTPLASMSPAQRSTYKVVRAVAEQECIGFFDGINAYDNAFVSLGPCHWTLGVVFKSSVERGELLGFLAYLRAVEPEAFARAVEWFGMRPDLDWVDKDGAATGQRLFDKQTRKYMGWPALQQADGSWAAMPRTEEEGDWFKTWHWVYRFLMAGRTIGPWQRRMWHMARVRLRDVRSAPWPDDAGVPAVVAGGASRPATIGDVYGSERAAAFLLRWHVYRPAHMVMDGHAGPELVKAFKKAAIPAAAGDPTTWTDEHQAKLIQGLWDRAQEVGTTDLKNTLTRVRDWPSWAADADRPYALDPAIGPLAVTARSFSFDAADLPPAPAYS